MRHNVVRSVVIVILFVFSSANLISQSSILDRTLFSTDRSLVQKKSSFRSTDGEGYAHLFMGSLVVLFVTPTVVYEDKKAYFGLGRELSLTFGKTNEYRISAEYTYLFRSNLKHHFRASIKYDILSGMSRDEWIDIREFISIGAGYFFDHDGGGIFPEVAGGFRIEAWETFYLYPYIKLRHTFMTSGIKPDNTDISIGMAIGLNAF